jgi:hypothetical protein
MLIPKKEIFQFTILKQVLDPYGWWKYRFGPTLLTVSKISFQGITQGLCKVKYQIESTHNNNG